MIGKKNLLGKDGLVDAIQSMIEFEFSEKQITRLSKRGMASAKITDR